MSLINQMLKDLDKRRGKSGDIDASKGLEASTAKTKRNRTLPYTIIILVIVICIAIYFVWFTKPISATKQIVHKVKLIKAQPNQLNAIQYQQKKNTAKLVFQFSQKPHTSMSLAPDHSSITLGIGKATLKAPLPVIKNQIFFTGLNYIPGNSNIIKIGLAKNARVTNLHTATKAPYTLTLTVSTPKKVIATPKPQQPAKTIPIEKKTVPKTPEQIKTTTFNRLLSALLKQNHKAAVVGMRSFANENPSYIPAQITLATYYAKNKDYMKSLIAINTAIQNNPNEISLITLKARILVAQGQTKAASNLLSQYSPNIKKHPNFYVLIAAVEQQMGSSELAAQYYQELIGTDVSNGKYWLGYGLALKQLGRNNAAVRAFKQALTSEDINANLKAFLRTQIEILGA